MNRSKNVTTELGQALVLVIIALVVLFALVALAVDGGNLYADRRNAQNAADAAAFAGALVKAQKGNTAQISSAALSRAASNGYVDSDPAQNNTPVDVMVYNPPIDGNHAGDQRYVQVKIHSTVNTYFAQIIGFDTLSTTVSAVAIGLSEEISDYFTGSAIFALNPHECKALSFTGSSEAIIKKGGLFVNSDCNNSGPQMAFYLNNDVTAPWVEIVGGGYLHDTLNLTGSSAVQSGVPQVPYPPPIAWPTKELDAACAKLPNRTDTGNSFNPGNYAGFSPNQAGTLAPGIYCINTGDLTLNKNLSGTGVLFYVKVGKITVNANAKVELVGYDKSPFKGLLFFMPFENKSNVVVNGGSATTFTGTFLCPGSHITLSGGGNSNGFNSQIIGDTVEITGDQALYLEYNASDNYTPKLLPSLQLTE